MLDEIRQNKKVMLITVAAVIFLVLMLSALVMNLVKIASLNSRKAALAAELSRMNSIIETNQSEIDYRKTDEYIDRYAREYLGMIGKDELAFSGK